MKSNELMIGDWVYNKNTNCNIQVYPTMFSQMFRQHPDATTEDYNIFPIPLTGELLEKNGFVKKEDNKFVCSCHLVVPTINKENSPIIQINFYKDPIAGVNTLLRCWSPTSPDYEGINEMHLCNLESVHELQHALKLCKIKKEIEL